MKCEKCGNEILEGQVVCLVCGAEVPGNNKKAEETTGDNNVEQPDTQTNESADNKPDTPKDTQSESQPKPQSKPKPKKVRVKKDHTSLIIVLCLFITTILLGVLGWIIYYRLFTTPKTIFLNSLDTLYDEAIMPIDSVRSNGEYNIKYTSNNNVDSNDEIISFLSKINFSADGVVDYSNKEFLGNVDFKYDDNSLFSNKNVYGKDKNIYIKSQSLGNYVEMKNKYSDFFSADSAKIGAYKTLLKELKKALNVALKSSYFKSYKETLNVDGIDKEVTKNEIIINNDNIKSIHHDLIKYLSKSNKYISAVSKLSSKKKKNIKEDLNKSLKNLEKDNTKVQIETLVADIYTQGFKNEFVKFTLKKGEGHKEVLTLTRDKDLNYNIKVDINDKYMMINIGKKEIPEKTIYSVNYYNGFERVQLSIESSLNRKNNKIESNIKNPIDYKKVDDFMKSTIKRDIMDEMVKEDYETAKKEVKKWFKDTFKLFKPSIEVGIDEEPDNVEEEENEEYEPPSNQTSIQGLGGESINQ